MNRSPWHWLLCVVLIAGCGGGDEPSDGTPGEDGANPPVVEGSGDGHSGDGAADGGSTITDPGQIVQPTSDDSQQRAKARKMDVAALISALNDADLGDACSDELASRGTEAVKPLIDALESDDTALVQRAIFTLGQLGPTAKDALPKLNKLAADSDSEVVQDSAKFAIDAIEGN